MTHRTTDIFNRAAHHATRSCLALVLGVVLLTAGSSPHAIAAEATKADMPIKEFMGHVIAYSAQNVWSKQGWVTDKDGFRSIFPQTDAEWEDAESAALTLSELIKILSQPGRRMNVPGWDGYVQALSKFALDAAAAAEHHQETEFMELGTRIDEACEACHIASGIK